MEAQSILYFYPAPEGMYKNDALKRHWWQKTALQGRALTGENSEEGFLLAECPVPSFYYQKKPWTPEVLSAAMDEALQRTAGMADAFLHPQVVTYVSEKYRERWEPRRETLENLMSVLLARYAADHLYEQGEAVVLLGGSEETAWQMEMTARLLWPYLSRINRLSFFYEEVEGVDIWEETADCLDAYGYEYGLAPRMIPYTQGEEGLQCGMEKCGGVILDYCPSVRHPRMRHKERIVYIDLCSDRTKALACGRKGGEILYVSPLKYLDTVVKSSYDKKMYATAMKTEGFSSMHCDSNIY